MFSFKVQFLQPIFIILVVESTLAQQRIFGECNGQRKELLKWEPSKNVCPTVRLGDLQLVRRPFHIDPY